MGSNSFLNEMKKNAVDKENFIKTDGRNCCFTGHRKIKEEDLENVSYLLDQVLLSLIQKGITDFFCGGAVGFDMLCAKKVIDFKNMCSTDKSLGFDQKIRLNLILPFRDHFAFWNHSDISQFFFISNQADDIKYADKDYKISSMHTRNRMLVDSSDICVCYLRQHSGGTVYTVSYAEKNKKPIIRL